MSYFTNLVNSLKGDPNLWWAVMLLVVVVALYMVIPTLRMRRMWRQALQRVLEAVRRSPEWQVEARPHQITAAEAHGVLAVLRPSSPWIISGGMTDATLCARTGSGRTEQALVMSSQTSNMRSGTLTFVRQGKAAAFFVGIVFQSVNAAEVEYVIRMAEHPEATHGNVVIMGSEKHPLPNTVQPKIDQWFATAPKWTTCYWKGTTVVVWLSVSIDDDFSGILKTLQHLAETFPA